MLYKTHVVGGLALGYVVFSNVSMLNVNLTESKSLLIAASGLAIGSLFPDIDHQNSFLSRKVKPLSWLTSKVLKHREFTHSIVGTISIYYLLKLILDKIAIDILLSDIFLKAFIIGMISHILLDMLTVAGVVLFYPLSKKRIGVGIFHKKLYIKVGFKELITLIFLIVMAYFAYKIQK